MSVDHWALGILIYEMLAGFNPFYFNADINQMDLFQSILNDDYDDAPLHNGTINSMGADIVAQLLEKNPSDRIGSFGNGPIEILRHPWFDALDLTALRNRQIKAPWVPELSDPYDVSYFNDWSSLEDKTCMPQRPVADKDEHLFKDF